MVSDPEVSQKNTGSEASQAKKAKSRQRQENDPIDGPLNALGATAQVVPSMVSTLLALHAQLPGRVRSMVTDRFDFSIDLSELPWC